MTSLNKNRQSGFTIVELLIVIVIIGILAGLVITQILGANQQARDTDRKNSINAVNTQIEAYFAQKGAYPSADKISNDTWRRANNFNVSDGAKALKDPLSDATSLQTDLPDATKRDYAYIATPDGCISPTDDEGKAVSGNTCSGYELIALLENKSDAQKDAARSTNDIAYYVKRNSNQ